MAQNPINYWTSSTYIGGYHIKCNGQNTGSIKANPNFGTGPHTFLWNTGETTAQINNKGAGIYYVTMTDSLNVSHTDTFELKQPYALSYQSTLSDFYGYNISSYGGNNGTIQLSATGGTPPYRYTWNNGDSVANRRDLTAGTYSFTITDANQCSTAGSYTLTAPNPIQVSFSNIEQLTCFKSNDGKATLNISGGLGNYSVVWENGSFSLSPEDLLAGYNEVRIYEHGTAVMDTGITLTQPDVLDIQFTYSDYNGYHVSCVDCFNGTVAAGVTGGTAPYTYQWEDVNSSTTPNLSNLNGGDYPIKVTDAKGCKMGNTAQLSMPTPKDWSRHGNANIDTSEFIGSTDTSAVVFKTNSQEALRIAGNGNVGVGINNPSEKLEVNGTIKAEGLKIDNFEIKYAAATSTTPESITWGRGETLLPAGPVAPLFPTTCIDPLNIERVNVYNGGAVYKVKTLVNANALCVASDPTLYVGLYGCNGAIEVNQIDDNGSQSFATSKLLINTLCGKDVIVGNTDEGNLIANHNVGIGLAAPIERLEVNGNTLVSGKLGIGNGQLDADLHIKNGITNSIIIENTQSPNKFKIEAAANYSRLISDGSIVLFFNSEMQQSDASFSINKNSASFSNNIELFKINNNGNSYFKEALSIGTNTFHPDFKLQVCGGVKAKRVKVEESWCDYVFDDNYDLLPLDEVEKYYKTYKHLPDIPSSSEIEINGLDLGKLVSLQMKKIEELTIHLVAMQKEIERLKSVSK